MPALLFAFLLQSDVTQNDFHLQSVVLQVFANKAIISLRFKNLVRHFDDKKNEIIMIMPCVLIDQILP